MIIFCTIAYEYYNKDNIIAIIINFRLPLVIFANIKFNIKKIRQSHIKNDYFSILFIYFFKYSIK